MTTKSPPSTKGLGAFGNNGLLAKNEKPAIPALAYRINDFVKAVGIGRTTVYKLIAEGKIRPIKVAGRVLIPANEISRLLREAGASQ